ncbi:hypothetical protein JTB14_028902 [Gonioctena quinquepunctata]|nr:hypothetical protein JTB14_028902 [Gonioctena quinquepunctata]
MLEEKRMEKLEEEKHRRRTRNVDRMGRNVDRKWNNVDKRKKNGCSEFWENDKLSRQLMEEVGAEQEE